MQVVLLYCVACPRRYLVSSRAAELETEPHSQPEGGGGPGRKREQPQLQPLRLLTRHSFNRQQRAVTTPFKCYRLSEIFKLLCNFSRVREAFNSIIPFHDMSPTKPSSSSSSSTVQRLQRSVGQAASAIPRRNKAMATTTTTTTTAMTKKTTTTSRKPPSGSRAVVEAKTKSASGPNDSIFHDGTATSRPAKLVSYFSNAAYGGDNKENIPLSGAIHSRGSVARVPRTSPTKGKSMFIQINRVIHLYFLFFSFYFLVFYFIQLPLPAPAPGFGFGFRFYYSLFFVLCC